MLFSLVCVVMLISPLSSISRERAAEVGQPYKRVCTMISDVPSVNTRMCVQRLYVYYVGDARSTAAEQADARVCLVGEDLLAPVCVLLLCQDVLYWDSSQSQRGRSSSEGDGRFQGRGDWAERSRPVVGDHQGGTYHGEADPSVCCLSDPHRAHSRNGRSPGMHRSHREWAGRRCPALRGSWHWQIAAGSGTATIC